MFPTPTALPSGGPTPPFDISIISQHINMQKSAIDAVGWWRFGMVETGLWSTAVPMLLLILILIAFVAIMVHINSLGDD